MAEQGEANAQNMLGVMYYKGEGVNQNYYEALKWYSKAEEQDYDEALKWYSKAAEQGDAYAQYILGAMYYNSEGVNQIYGEAEKLYRNNANQTSAIQYSNAGQYKVGDKITFGSYPFYEDGSEKEIDWIILDIDADGNALVISDYALDNVKYNEQYVNITWEDSSIRKWLNNDFLNKAFSPEQRSKIIESRIDNNGNAEYETRGGNATNDKVFLLSIDEGIRYFNSDESRIAYPTPYAKSKKSVNGNLYVSSSYVSTDRGGSCWWWLRSPGYSQRYAAYVYGGGDVESYGTGGVDHGSRAVRVAFKINLKNL